MVKYYRKLNENKYYFFCKRVLRKCKKVTLWSISASASFFLILLYPIYKIKFVSLISDRIGHYALNTELLLCYLDEIRNRNKKTKYFFYIREAPICNIQLHSMWKRKISIIRFTVIAGQISCILSAVLGNKYISDEIRRMENGSGLQDIHGRLRGHPPHLSFTEIEKKRGKELLLQLGISINAKWVCLVVRDSTYLEKYLPGIDWSHHFYRDCDIANFAKAALYLANKGYYVIRMGKAVAKKFDVVHSNIIDYATNSACSDFGDVFLSSHCEFFISTATGLDAIAQVFRKPLLQVNVAPFRGQLQYWYPCELFITKKIIDKNKNKFLTLKEIETIVMPAQNLKDQFERLNWSVVENTGEEILEAVKEIEKQITNINIHINKTKNDFHDILKSELSLSMIADREWIRSNPEKFYIKINSTFLEKNRHMFLE